MTETVEIGVIGGSGLYNMPQITDKTSYALETPYGKPSGEIVVGTLSGKRVAFLPRHGVGHIHTPSAVPYRANIYALKQMGVKFIIAVNACGSLREDYAPGHLVIPDQLYDYTKADRGRTFFDQNIVAHVSTADPFCPHLSQLLYDSVKAVDGTVHKGGTFVIIEGPRFSTKGESHIFRQWECSLIGMTTCPEAFLAREAEIAYATIAHVTDYDVWHTSAEPVTAEMVMTTLRQNISTVEQAITHAVGELGTAQQVAAHQALNDAVMTDLTLVPAQQLERLRPILARYLQTRS